MKAPVLSWWAPQLRAMVINPPVREAVSDRPRPLADKSTGPRPDWEMQPCGLGRRWLIFPALSLVGWSRAWGYEQAKWNTNAPPFPSEISIIHFHTFPWQHTVGFEGGAGNLNVPAVWKEVSDQQLCRRRRRRHRLLALRSLPTDPHRCVSSSREECLFFLRVPAKLVQSNSFLSVFLFENPPALLLDFQLIQGREKKKKKKSIILCRTFKEIPSLSHFIFINK